MSRLHFLLVMGHFFGSYACLCVYLTMLAGCWQNNSQATLCQSDRSSPENRGTEREKKVKEISARQHFLKHNYNLEYFFYKSAFYLQCIALIAFSNFQYECSQDVESLAVAHCFIPAGVGQQHPLQHHPVLLPLLAAVRTAAGPVQVLGIRRMQGGLFFNKSAHYLDKWMMNLCI